MTNSAEEIVYVQAGPGSFNHGALMDLQAQDSRLSGIEPKFAGTPLDAMTQATYNHAEGLVLIAGNNNLIGLIKPTIEAVRKFEIVKIIAKIKKEIVMCLLVKKDDTEVVRVASIQPALDQVSDWTRRKQLEVITEPKGTAEAARKLATNEYPSQTGVIGPKTLVDIYPNLGVAENSIENKPSYTDFLLLMVRKRKTILTPEEAHSELSKCFQVAAT
ncbi:MAG: prephenate dehydratase domain-containing protein [Candidatus Peregrinibacteria bacterium]|nr:prephenate dehydratase domain-containing protein [Candidatus Peregrinibacteria bacterium]